MSIATIAFCPVFHHGQPKAGYCLSVNSFSMQFLSTKYLSRKCSLCFEQSEQICNTVFFHPADLLCVFYWLLRVLHVNLKAEPGSMSPSWYLWHKNEWVYWLNTGYMNNLVQLVLGYTSEEYKVCFEIFKV